MSSPTSGQPSAQTSKTAVREAPSVVGPQMLGLLATVGSLAPSGSALSPSAGSLRGSESLLAMLCEQQWSQQQPQQQAASHLQSHETSDQHPLLARLLSLQRPSSQQVSHLNDDLVGAAASLAGGTFRGSSGGHGLLGDNPLYTQHAQAEFRKLLGTAEQRAVPLGLLTGSPSLIHPYPPAGGPLSGLFSDTSKFNPLVGFHQGSSFGGADFGAGQFFANVAGKSISSPAGGPQRSASTVSPKQKPLAASRAMVDAAHESKKRARSSDGGDESVSGKSKRARGGQRAAGKHCSHEGCSKLARSTTQFSAAHGGGRRCQNPGCPKSARGATQFCIAHGGGRRCTIDGCKKSAQGSTVLCIAHGGGRRCKQDGCHKSARGPTGFCKAHGGGKRCASFGCWKCVVDGSTMCKAHEDEGSASGVQGSPKLYPDSPPAVVVPQPSSLADLASLSMSWKP